MATLDASKPLYIMDHSKQSADEEEQAFLSPSTHNDAAWSQRRRDRKGTQYLRLALEFTMAVIIALLAAYILRERAEKDESKDEGMRSPVPKFPRKIYKFLPDSHFVRDDMLFKEQDTLETLHNWLPLSSEARGYVQIANYDDYPVLSKPYIVAINRTSDGPAYMTSIFHQLHCLSYIISHYQQGYAGTKLTDEVAHHSAHCFDYLRQSIMCAADTNLEGETETGPGWGSDHVCVDYDAVLEWANENAAMKWRTGLLPGIAIL